MERKLGTDTWYYAKRCVLSAATAVSRRTAVLSESNMRELLSFLDEADMQGRSILAVPARGFSKY